MHAVDEHLTCSAPVIVSEDTNCSDHGHLT